MVSAITIFENNIEKEVQAEKLYLDFVKTRLPKILKEDEEIMHTIDRLEKDSERHEKEFRAMTKKLLSE